MSIELYDSGIFDNHARFLVLFVFQRKRPQLDLACYYVHHFDKEWHKQLAHIASLLLDELRLTEPP